MSLADVELARFVENLLQRQRVRVSFLVARLKNIPSTKVLSILSLERECDLFRAF